MKDWGLAVRRGLARVAQRQVPVPDVESAASATAALRPAVGGSRVVCVASCSTSVTGTNRRAFALRSVPVPGEFIRNG